MYNSGKLVIESYAMGIKKCALSVAIVAKRAQKIKLKVNKRGLVECVTFTGRRWLTRYPKGKEWIKRRTSHNIRRLVKLLISTKVKPL